MLGMRPQARARAWWWTEGDLNPRPPACKAGILPVYTISPRAARRTRALLCLSGAGGGGRAEPKGFIGARAAGPPLALLESQRSLKAGDAAPDFDLVGTDGRRHSLSGYAGREGLLVIFMCNHCPYVKAKIDAIKEVHERFGDRVAVVGINSNDAVAYPDDSYEAMKAMAAERGIAFDYLVDETQEVARRYGATCTPDPFLFDSSMRLVFHGRIDDAMKPEDRATEKVMVNRVSAMLEGRPPGDDFDPSIGCSIKWRQD